MAATCRIVRLEEVVTEYRLLARKQVQEILNAIGDREITPSESRRIMEILDSWMDFAERISSELSVVADGAAMVRSLTSTFAVTPKVERNLREKATDYRHFVEDERGLIDLDAARIGRKVIPFPTTPFTPEAA